MAAWRLFKPRNRRAMSAGMALLAVLPLLLTPGSGTATAVPDSSTPLTGNHLLDRLTNPAVAATPLPQGARVEQHSSQEREGGNRDWGVWSDRDGRPPTFVRKDEEGWVLLDEQRPSCLTRMWFTAGLPIGHLGDVGRIQVYFDGETTPRVDAAAADLFSGDTAGFPRPLVGNSDDSSGGFYSYVPLCAASSLEVVVTDIPVDERLWYQLTTLVLPHGSPVRTYVPAEFRVSEAASALAEAGRPPSASPTAERDGTLPPGGQLPLVSATADGSVRYLRFRVSPWQAGALDDVFLEVTTDRASAPQISVPLPAAFGDGQNVRPVRATVFGMDPAAGTGYFAIPIPYEHGVDIRLVSRAQGPDAVPVTVRAQAWLGPPIPAAGVLHGRSTVETTLLGRDTTVLDAGEAGHLAAWVLDMRGPPGSNLGPLQFMLEGDERVHVDGSPSPTVYGTGTEDAFNGGFYYNRLAFTQPTHGAGPPGSVLDRALRSQYRVFAGDAITWENGIRFGLEHGGGDEHPGGVYASTVFYYSRPSLLHRTDELLPADGISAAEHDLRGASTPGQLTAYFEGERDGNGTVSPVPIFGGAEYPAPPPTESPEGVTAHGISFAEPVSFRLSIDTDNCGVVLRRLLDAGLPTRVDVRVDGRPVGPWTTEANPAKRWLASDFALPADVTAGRTQVTVELVPNGTATMYRIDAMTRSCA